jgi:hypothetical protein
MAQAVICTALLDSFGPAFARGLLSAYIRYMRTM